MRLSTGAKKERRVIMCYEVNMMDAIIYNHRGDCRIIADMGYMFMMDCRMVFPRYISSKHSQKLINIHQHHHEAGHEDHYDYIFPSMNVDYCTCDETVDVDETLVREVLFDTPTEFISISAKNENKIRGILI